MSCRCIATLIHIDREESMFRPLAAIVAASALAGCQVHAHEGGGATVSRSYSIGNFQEIEVAGPYDVEVRTGANPSVSARGAEKLLERTTVEVKGDKLVIRPENDHNWFHFGWSSHGKANFTVTVPQLSGGTTAGSGDVDISGGAKCNVSKMGSGNVRCS